jgi:hypothetical protein
MWHLKFITPASAPESMKELACAADLKHQCQILDCGVIQVPQLKFGMSCGRRAYRRELEMAELANLAATTTTSWPADEE